MRIHEVINSVVIAIVAIVCLMNSMNNISMVNIAKAQNNVLMQMAGELNKIQGLDERGNPKGIENE